MIYGNGGRDYIYGNYGNNTLYGGAGEDVFVYTGGKNVITDYTAGPDKIAVDSEPDMIQITGNWSVSYNSSTKTVALKVGSTYNAIRLKDFTASIFHVNDAMYRISGNKLVKQ